MTLNVITKTGSKFHIDVRGIDCIAKSKKRDYATVVMKRTGLDHAKLSKCDGKILVRGCPKQLSKKLAHLRQHAAH